MTRRLVLAALLTTLMACSPPTSGTMRGVVVEVNGDLTDVDDFTVLVEGDRIRFEPSPTGDFAFPLPHLAEHLRTGEPVLVGWELTDGVHVATSLDDG